MRACTPFMSTIRTTNRRWRPSSRRHFQYRLSRYPVPGQSERLQVRHLHHRSRNVTASPVGRGSIPPERLNIGSGGVTRRGRTTIRA